MDVVAGDGVGGRLPCGAWEVPLVDRGSNNSYSNLLHCCRRCCWGRPAAKRPSVQAAVRC